METCHGIGSFIIGPGEGPPFSITPEQPGTLQDVVAVPELRMGVETEAAGLAAQRRTADNLAAPRRAGRWMRSSRPSRRGGTRSRPTSSSTWRSPARRRTAISPT